MKVLVVGDWHSELHEAAVEYALRVLGHVPLRFEWHRYFRDAGGRASIAARFQNKYLVGPVLARLNRDLVAAAAESRPDLVFVYRGTHVFPATIHAIRAAVPGVAIVGYNNDDPFGPRQPAYLWRHFLACLPTYDAVLAYRHLNLADYERLGARRVRLLRSWYMPERNRPVDLSPAERERFGCDVVFVGHHEDDGRVETLERVVQAGWRLRLFGPGYDWDPVIARSRWLRDLRPVQLVWGDDYNRALCGAKVALCFFSRLNRDTYTRRCFEIPASGTLLFSEYSDDLASLFAPGREAAYFRDGPEFERELRRYLSDDALRASVAQAGHERVRRDGHDVVSRMRDLLAWLGSSGLHREPDPAEPVLEATS